MNKLILCSVSPRRKFLLKELGFKFAVRKPRFAEQKIEQYSVHKLFEMTRIKLLPLPKKREKKIFIAADTIVVLKNKIFNKPVSRIEAKKFLKQLSGKTHQVMTALVVFDASKRKFYEKLTKTKVVFRRLSEAQIENYLKTKEYRDKAGGYAIQGKGAVLVKSMNGSYTNVIGLPLEALVDILPS